MIECNLILKWSGPIWSNHSNKAIYTYIKHRGKSFADIASNGAHWRDIPVLGVLPTGIVPQR